MLAKRLARCILQFSLRHSSSCTRPWVEGMLAEVDAIPGGTEALRWALGSVLALSQEGLRKGFRMARPRLLFSIGIALSCYAILLVFATSRVVFHYATNIRSASATVLNCKQTTFISKSGEQLYFTNVVLQFPYEGESHIAKVRLFSDKPDQAAAKTAAYALGTVHPVKFDRFTAQGVTVKDDDIRPIVVRSLAVSTVAVLFVGFGMVFIGKRKII
jgi:hypothetical protein